MIVGGWLWVCGSVNEYDLKDIMQSEAGSVFPGDNILDECKAKPSTTVLNLLTSRSPPYPFPGSTSSIYYPTKSWIVSLRPYIGILVFKTECMFFHSDDGSHSHGK